ncbi:MAG: peptidoglycan synthetase [Saprospiraceae bacterium]|nr:peptidoglycan synthetase [Saprospiraceae bacterium]
MRIHLIAMGGAVMHNLALALQKNGHFVTGSDDEIYNPAKERLEKAGLLPEMFGWFPEKITTDLDLAILGMHARADNPELLRAQEMGVRVMSFPEFIYKHSQDKKRIVVAGSHGKTTTTSMIMHVLRNVGIDFDYLVGAQLEGFDTMVRLSDAPFMVIEGDEYLSSPIDRRPKFLHYRPHVAVITGVAWDHINVFPTYKEYCHQFELLLQNMEAEGNLFYYGPDKDLSDIVNRSESEIYATPYYSLPYKIMYGGTVVRTSDKDIVKLEIFGDHNLANLSAARFVCSTIGIRDWTFWKAIQTFKGAAKRLQNLVSAESFSAWLDFAHAPSKAKATVEAVRKLHPERRLIACLELHTFSSLNKDFLPLYNGSLQPADVAAVFYSPHTLEMKKMPPVAPAEIQAAFGKSGLQVFTERAELEAFIKNQNLENANLLLMSSGNFGGMDIPGFVGGLPTK